MIATVYWTWWQGALALASLASVYWLVEHRLLGVSGSINVVADRPSGGKESATEQGCGGGPVSDARPLSQHVLVLIGIVGGAALSALLAGRFAPEGGLGGTFEALFGSGWAAPAILVAGGVLVGLGTRLAGGCTSGHGLCGTARLNPPSVLSTITFFGVGVSVSLLLSILFLSGGASV